MEVKIVQIGNSKGIRIPKVVLEQCEVADKVELVVEKRRIILIPIEPSPRADWEAAAERMRNLGDDALLIPDAFGDDLDEEW